MCGPSLEAYFSKPSSSWSLAWFLLLPRCLHYFNPPDWPYPAVNPISSSKTSITLLCAEKNFKTRTASLHGRPHSPHSCPLLTPDHSFLTPRPSSPWEPACRVLIHISAPAPFASVIPNHLVSSCYSPCGHDCNYNSDDKVCTSRSTKENRSTTGSDLGSHLAQPCPVHPASLQVKQLRPSPTQLSVQAPGQPECESQEDLKAGTASEWYTWEMGLRVTWPRQKLNISVQFQVGA